MTSAIFYKLQDTYTGFKIEGHALLSVETPDVLCAAISGMTGLVMNTLCEVFGVEAELDTDESVPSIEFHCRTCPDRERSAVSKVIKGFLLQLEDLSDQYPENLCVTVQQNTTKGTREK